MDDQVLIQSCPNFSDGRRPGVIQEIVRALSEWPGVKLLDVNSDATHNRTVVTLAGEPDAVLRGALAGTARAADLIDMETHTGAHPRIGAMDVIPIVPLQGLEMADCVELARRLGNLIAEQCGIPVYLYGEAATVPERRELEFIQKRQYERLKEEIGLAPVRPDFGNARLHPTAGAVAVGARQILICFNLYLGTSRLDVARSIAKAVRASGGGFVHVKAIGLSLEGGTEVQVSTEITDYLKTPLYRVYQFVEREAIYHGTFITRSEIVGLIPQSVLWDVALRSLKLESFGPGQLLEARLRE
jgi:glutamate formiminotransferase